MFFLCQCDHVRSQAYKSGRVKSVCYCGRDSLAKFTINGFNSLRILSNEICTLFDEGRKGLNRVKEQPFLYWKKNQASPKKYMVAGGYANANDAFHASSLSDDAAGPYKVMKPWKRSRAISCRYRFHKRTWYRYRKQWSCWKHCHEKTLQWDSTIRFYQKPIPGIPLGAAAAIEAVYAILNLSTRKFTRNFMYRLRQRV